MTARETFVYRLVIDNRSVYELAYDGGELQRGRWFRENEKDNRPVSVLPGETTEAMAITASPGKGYACLCAWSLRGPAPATITLRIDVPFLSGRNRAGLDVSGAVRVEGWSGIPTVGNVFTHTLVIRSHQSDRRPPMGLGAFTMIRLADGTEKRVSDLDVGDSVFDPVLGRAATVTAVDGSPGVGMTEVETETGRVLHLTGDHVVYIDGGAVRAEQLRRGNRVYSVDGLAACASAGALAGDFKVYDVRGDGLSGLSANGLTVGV